MPLYTLEDSRVSITIHGIDVSREILVRVYDLFPSVLKTMMCQKVVGTYQITLRHVNGAELAQTCVPSSGGWSYTMTLSSPWASQDVKMAMPFTDFIRSLLEHDTQVTRITCSHAS